MPGYKCKKCDTKNTVLKEWVELGINRVVTCKSCGHKMNLNLVPNNTPGTQIVETSQSYKHSTENNKGTNVVGTNKTSISTYYFQIISKFQNREKFTMQEINNSFTLFIGRNPKDNNNDPKNNTWIIDDPYISRTHCIINITLNNNKIQFIIEDNNSSNGTAVNTTKLETEDRVLINLGDQITIGDTIFILMKE